MSGLSCFKNPTSGPRIKATRSAASDRSTTSGGHRPLGDKRLTGLGSKGTKASQITSIVAGGSGTLSKLTLSPSRTKSLMVGSFQIALTCKKHGCSDREIDCCSTRTLRSSKIR